MWKLLISNNLRDSSTGTWNDKTESWSLSHYSNHTLLTIVKCVLTHLSESAAAHLDSHCGTEKLCPVPTTLDFSVSIYISFREKKHLFWKLTLEWCTSNRRKCALHVGNQSSIPLPAIIMIRAFSGLPKSYQTAGIVPPHLSKFTTT
jgi:hypothetical protein